MPKAAAQKAAAPKASDAVQAEGAAVASKKGQSKRSDAKTDAKTEWIAMSKSVSADMFTINAIFVPAALQLGPGMSDSGETAMER